MIPIAPVVLDRRGFLSAAGAFSAAAATGSLLSACGSPAPDQPIRIGWVSPETGPLSPFGAADKFVIAGAEAYFAQHPIVVAGTPHQVQIVKSDSQSSPERAGDVAADLIRNGGIHMMLVSSTPDTANPVSDQCEASGMPCVATTVPWQAWFNGRGGKPDKPFKWTFQFFFGLEDFAAAFLNMWDSMPTNKVVGTLWPADSDGFAWGDPTTGFPSFMVKRGYREIDTGSFPTGSQDFSRQIDAFEQAGAQIVTGVLTPNDFGAFWRQAAQRGFRPKIVTVAKANLSPGAVESLGPALGNNLTTNVYWSGAFPFTSSVTGQTAQQLADAYTQQTGKQPIMATGFSHALVEVAAKAFASVGRIDDRAALAEAIRTMKIDTIVGPLDWTTGPAPGATSATMVGGQWRATNGGQFPFDLVVVNNQAHPNIPASGTLAPL